MENADFVNPKLLSIISASNRPHNMGAFLENLQATVVDPSAIEVLVKIDEGDDQMRLLLDEAIAKYEFEIRYIQTAKLDGYYTLHLGYQELFELSDPHTYFILPINEEVRFMTHGWDQILRRYIKLYPDDVFRLKISKLKYRNYLSYHDCGPCPENYPILTRKWMELAEGIGDCWGPDGWHQFIDHHLSVTPGLNNIPGIFRSIPILDIQLTGEEAGRELSKAQERYRADRVWKEWWRMYSPTVQQRLRRIAMKMYCYIWAKNENLADFEIVENKKKCIFYIKQRNHSVKSFHYFLSPNYIRYKNFSYLVKKARQNSVGFTKTFIFHGQYPRHFLLKFADISLRIATVMCAFAISIFTLGFESAPKSMTTRMIERFKNLMYKIVKKSMGERAANSIKRVYKKLGKGSAY
ncbi:MAG: hypothetical protein H0W64_00435 [Gammaproteobacteria bacterium]|nr:hypothetical protein [Gammaproteobacteria bacterium]